MTYWLLCRPTRPPRPRGDRLPDARHLPHRNAGRAATAPRMTRASKAEATRRNLIDAAARVVGAEGYANASVAKITALADVAQGTFYNYFDSQQDLFDHLLPELGGQLLDFIRERVASEGDSFKREEIGFRAFFEFVRARPEFYRILNEAETFSPKAFADHMRNMAEGYLRALRSSAAKGELAGFEDRELEVVVYILLAARNYLAFRYMRSAAAPAPLPDWIVRAYMKLLDHGIRADQRSRGAARSRGQVPAASVAASPAQRLIARSANGAAVEMKVVASDRDSDGCVVRSALLELLEAAGRQIAQGAAATHAGSVMPELLSFSANFPRRSPAARLIGSGSAEITGSHVVATLAIHEAGRRDQAPVATAHALYRLPGLPPAHASAPLPSAKLRRKLRKR